YELDTDKVTQEVEAEASGVLLKILVAEGEVPVGTAVAYVGDAGEEIPEAAEAAAEAAAARAGTGTEAPEEEEPPPREVPVPEVRAAAATTTNGGRIKASPLARRIARERGIDLAALSGTG